MAKLGQFSDQATPVFSEFRSGAPAIARATRALGPFAQAARPSLITLGTAAQESQQPLVNSDPIIRKVGKLAKKSAPGAKTLANVLASLRKTGGTKFLMNFLFNTTGGVNGYDQYGHFLRALLVIPPGGCTALSTTIVPGCEAQWGLAASTVSKAAARRAAANQPSEVAKLIAKAKAQTQAGTGGTPAGAGAAASPSAGSGTVQPGQPLDAEGQPPAGTTTTTPSTSGGQPRAPSLSAARDLFDTLIGSPHHSQRGKRR
jgi:hypothetical protein